MLKLNDKVLIDGEVFVVTEIDEDEEMAILSNGTDEIYEPTWYENYNIIK